MSLITQLNDVMARRGYTQTHVARAIGRSSAVINQYLQGKYQGDMADIEERISAFVTREREKENSRRIKAKFVTTGMAAKGLEVLAYAHLECEICVLYGAAGLGKTMILREYAARKWLPRGGCQSLTSKALPPVWATPSPLRSRDHSGWG